MSQYPKPNLLLLRFNDIERAAILYATLGLSFKKEQHGKGPVYYACDTGGFVFELYPIAEGQGTTGVRVGSTVEDVDDSVATWEAASGKVATQPRESPWGRRAVAIDDEGHRVELVQTMTE